MGRRSRGSRTPPDGGRGSLARMAPDPSVVDRTPIGIGLFLRSAAGRSALPRLVTKELVTNGNRGGQVPAGFVASPEANRNRIRAYAKSGRTTTLAYDPRNPDAWAVARRRGNHTGGVACNDSGAAFAQSRNFYWAITFRTDGQAAGQVD